MVETDSQPPNTGCVESTTTSEVIGTVMFPSEAHPSNAPLPNTMVWESTSNTERLEAPMKAYSPTDVIVDTNVRVPFNPVHPRNMFAPIDLTPVPNWTVIGT